MRPFSFSSLSLSSGHISICVASVRRSPHRRNPKAVFYRTNGKSGRGRPSALWGERACASVACLSESAIPYLPRSHPFLGRSLSSFILLSESSVMLIRSRNPIGAVSITAAMHSFPYSTVRPSVRRQFAMWTGGARVYPQIQSVSQPRNLFGRPLRGRGDLRATSEVVSGRSDEGPPCACLIDVF